MNRKKNQAIYHHAKDLGGLEFMCADYYDQRFSRHVHEGTCIGVIDTGAQEFYSSGENHLAPRDSIILVNADQVHDGHTATEHGWSYRAMYPDPDMLAGLSVELDGGYNDIPWFPEHVVFDPQLADKLRQLFNVLQHSDQQLERETRYLDTMTQLILRHAKSRSQLLALGREPKAIQTVRDYLDAHISDNVSINQLARMVELSPFYLTRLFQKTQGLPPHAYQLQRRLHKAKRLIHLGYSISDTAVNCGFTDQSHLNRHFKKSLGITPGAYQRHCKLN